MSCFYLSLMTYPLLSQTIPSKTLLDAWTSILTDSSCISDLCSDSAGWQAVTIPHNWDHYHGYHAVSHGNLHGSAWYRTHFEHGDSDEERVYVYFEGVGSYATVFVNGTQVGYHAGGRTTFTVDLTEALVQGSNELMVLAEHPEKIDDLPFVCGGCWGAPNTEGSQPFGIFRPVWLERTGPIRVEPFGVHVLTPLVSESRARVVTRTTVLNPSGSAGVAQLRQTIYDGDENAICTKACPVDLNGEVEVVVELEFPEWSAPQLWSPESPILHRVKTEVIHDGIISQETETNFGLRWIEWPLIERPDADHNVVSADRRGRLIDSGEVDRTQENNGLTEVLSLGHAVSVSLTPMGVEVFQSKHTSAEHAELEIALNLRSSEPSTEVQLLCEIQNEGGTIFFHQYRAGLTLTKGSLRHDWKVPQILYPHIWTSGDPYLHRLLVEIRTPDGRLLERSETLFGIRNQGWDCQRPLNLARPKYEALPQPASESGDEPRERRLMLNGRPLFLNGTCEYETMLGCDHAFTDAQIAADVKMMEAAGFNAFRDAHHPHNLRYYDHWDKAGIVCWTQMGSHIWFDNERFKENYRLLVTEWVKERRNHPCIIIWGLQNESAMPEAFTRELRDIIRELDPTSPQWRITTTCNGGKGSDWNVPQEWSGTYGGNCHDYDLKEAQMVGEYGAWRNFAVHTEVDYAGDENDRSESWACAAMETKVRRAELMRDESIGHFHWIFNSFPNPGRAPDNFEGPDNAEIGSINNKGLVTAWHQPSDLYYMFRSNYTDPTQDPMVYIVSHTWPNRWKEPIARNISVYSNCECVELFNGVRTRSLGKQTKLERGYHFIWKDVLPESNLLYAVGYRDGEIIAEDLIRLEGLPDDPSLLEWVGTVDTSEVSPALCRVNCGANEAFTDENGQVWSADSVWSAGADFGWESWGHLFDNVPDDIASRGESMTPVRDTDLQEIYRQYRYGREYLKYHFKVGPGRYRLRCHFAEPWFGVGGFAASEGLRVFDVAINGQVVDPQLDICSRASGPHKALVRDYTVEISEELLTLHFPTIQVNQAIIHAIECFEL